MCLTLRARTCGASANPLSCGFVWLTADGERLIAAPQNRPDDYDRIVTILGLAFTFAPMAFSE